MELKDQQEPLSVADQIKNLKEIGLTIKDEAIAASFLNDVSYFRFIKAYSLGLKPKNGRYHNGVSLQIPANPVSMRSWILRYELP